MAWFKVDDHLHASRKAAKAGAPAMGLWVLAGSWSAAEELDGFVPAYMVTRLAGADGVEMANALLAAGLWVTGEHDGEDGYRFHAWDEYQPTRDQQERKRAEARERMRRARSQGDDVRANKTRSDTNPTRPDPTPTTPAAKAADPAEFESWWEGYPRKIGKAAAAKAYAKARKTATAQQLIDGQANAAAVWQASRTEPQFIPHPSTWLNQGRWEDEQLSLPGTPDTATRRTLAQCQSPDCPGRPHPWEDTHNRYHCQGA